MGSPPTARELTAVAAPAHDSTVALLVRPGPATTRRHRHRGRGRRHHRGPASPSVAGARSVTVVEPDGTREPGRCRSGPTRRPGSPSCASPTTCPAATFTAEDPATGSVAVAMAEDARRRRRAAPVTPALRRHRPVLRGGHGHLAGHRVLRHRRRRAADRRPTSAAPWSTPPGRSPGILDAVVGTDARPDLGLPPGRARRGRRRPDREPRLGRPRRARAPGSSTPSAAARADRRRRCASVRRRAGRPPRPGCEPGDRDRGRRRRRRCARWPNCPPGSTATRPGSAAPLHRRARRRHLRAPRWSSTRRADGRRPRAAATGSRGVARRSMGP